MSLPQKRTIETDLVPGPLWQLRGQQSGAHRFAQHHLCHAKTEDGRALLGVYFAAETEVAEQLVRRPSHHLRHTGAIVKITVAERHLDGLLAGL